MAEGKKLSPPGVFAFTQSDRTHGLIILEHVACVRWDGNQLPNLYVYFASNVPHVKLEERQGKELIEMLTALDEYRRAILAL